MNLREALARLRPAPAAPPVSGRVAPGTPAGTATPPDPTRCRRCGAPVDWTRPGGVAFADGGSAHVRCHDEAEVARLVAVAERAVRSSDALADEAELTTRGEPLP
jgi:hypothetical protein